MDRYRFLTVTGFKLKDLEVCFPAFITLNTPAPLLSLHRTMIDSTRLFMFGPDVIRKITVERRN